MDQNGCRNCGKELSGAGEVLCPDCRGDVRRKRVRHLWYSFFAVTIFLLAGAAFLYAERQSWEFSWDALTGKPAGVVNGEPIARSEARERIHVGRLMLERAYGKGLFAGQEGGELLGRLKRDVLEKMVDERLVAQEAERLKIRVEDRQVRQEIDKIGREIYGSRENFQASMKEEGISEAYLANHVRNLLIRRELKKAKSPPKADPDTYFAAWLTQERQNARVSLSQTIAPPNTFAQAGGSCCGSGGAGGCGSKQDPAKLDPALQSKAGGVALAEYRKNHPSEKGLEAKVTDYGCHIQVDIEKEGRKLWSYSYQDGSVTDN